MSCLLDTNIISEFRKRDRANPRVDYLLDVEPGRFVPSTGAG